MNDVKLGKGSNSNGTDSIIAKSTIEEIAKFNSPISQFQISKF